MESHGLGPADGKVGSLPAGGALELDGGVFDAEFGEALLQFRHDTVALSQRQVIGNDVRAQGNVT